MSWVNKKCKTYNIPITKSSKIQSIIKTSSLSTDEVVDAIIDNCSHKISDALASKILTPNEITKEIEENEEYDKLISFVKEEDKRKSYIITELGKEVLEIELRRIKRLYRNSIGEY